MSKLKPSISLPFYHLNSEVLKLILNVKDDRSVIKRLTAANVPIKDFGGQKVVMHDDLLASIQSPSHKPVEKYQAKGDISPSLRRLLSE